MGVDTKIEWCHHTFNPWWGCVKVSEACRRCYAESFAKRVGQKVWGPEAPRRFFGDKHWAEPLKWDRAAAAAGERRRVFCASMADVFEDRPDLIEPRSRLMLLIDATPNLDWLLLTKRPDVMHDYLRDQPLRKNIWAGTTVEEQERGNERVAWLLQTNAVLRFLSMEPLLEHIDVRPALKSIDGIRIDWVIVGGESGHGARPLHPDWARSIRDQCTAAGVPFFFKQWGEWAPRTYGKEGNSDAFQMMFFVDDPGVEPVVFSRTGKADAGRELDGRTWDEFPEIVAQEEAA